jgi:hypothetical protein
VLALFYTLGVLVQLPNTRVLRLSILVLMGTLAWRVSTRYNFDGSDEPGYNLGSMTVCVRSVSLIKRHHRPDLMLTAYDSGFCLS